MMSASPFPVTPRRKRAVSGADLAAYDVLVKIEKQFTPQNTPDMQVPGLDWETEPTPRDVSPSTPSSITTSSKVLAIDEQAHATPTRELKKPRPINRLRLRESSEAVLYTPTDNRPVKLQANDHKPALLFPVPLRSGLSVVKSEHDESQNSFQVYVEPKVFEFHRLSRLPSRYSFANSKNAVIPAQRIFHPPGEQQSPGLRNSTRSIGTTGQTARSSQALTPVPQVISTKAAAVPRSPDVIKPRNDIEESSTPQGHHTSGRAIKLPATGAALLRFTRMLPFNTIARIFEDPNRCVASLVQWPDQRCSRSRKSAKDAKAWLLDHIANHFNPANVFVAESYLRNLMDMATCTQHKSISIAQLERLLDRCGTTLVSNADVGQSRHAFQSKDEKAIPCWLEALTRLPACHEDVAGPNQRVHTPVSNFDPASVNMPASSSASKHNKNTSKSVLASQVAVQEDWHVTAIDTATCTTSIEATQTAQETCTIAETVETRETRSTVELRRTVDTTRREQATQIEETAKIASTTETTFVNELRSETIERPETLNKITTRTAISTHSIFDPTQTVEISFITTQEENETKDRDKTSIQTRSTTTRELIVCSLGQSFVPYSSKASDGLSTEAWIRERLVEPITMQDTEEGLIYMYWVKGNFGLVKIGKTSGKSTRKRLLKWQVDCGHELQEHTRGEEEVAVQLPNVYRIEKLVQAELKNVRLVESACVQCSKRLNRAKSHVEWFGCSPDHAMKVIEKWSKWVRTKKPYEFTGELSKANGKKIYVGRLKSTISEEEINKMCTPIEMPKHHKGARPPLRGHVSSDRPTRKAKGRKRST